LGRRRGGRRRIPEIPGAIPEDTVLDGITELPEK